jgi:hypothetical protein
MTMVDPIPVWFMQSEAEPFFDSRGGKFSKGDDVQRFNFVGLEKDFVCRIAYQEKKKGCFSKIWTACKGNEWPEEVSLFVRDTETSKVKRVWIDVNELAKRFFLSEREIIEKRDRGSFQNWFKGEFRKTDLKDLTWIHKQQKLVFENTSLRVMNLGLLPSSYNRTLEMFHSHQHRLIVIAGNLQNNKLRRNVFDLTLRKLMQVRSVNCNESKMVRACFDKAIPNMRTDYHLQLSAANLEYLLYPQPGASLRLTLASLSIEEKKYIAHQIVIALTKYHRNGLLYGNLNVDNIYYKRQGRCVSLGSFEGTLNVDKVCSMLKHSRHNKHFCRLLRSFFPYFGQFEENKILEILSNTSSNHVQQAKQVWGILQTREMYCLGRLLFNLLCEANFKEEQDGVIWNNLSEHLRIRGNTLDIYALIRLIDKGFDFMQADAFIGMLNDDYHLRPNIEQVLTAFNAVSMSSVFKRNCQIKSASLEFWQKAPGYAKIIRETFYNSYYRGRGRKPREEELVNWTSLERALADFYYYRFNSVVKSNILKVVGRLCQRTSLRQLDYNLNKVCNERNFDLEDILGQLSQFERDNYSEGANNPRSVFIDDYKMFNALYSL